MRGRLQIEPCSQHGDAATSWPPWEGRIELAELVGAQRHSRCARVLLGVGDVGRFGDREQARPPREEGEGHLARRGSVAVGDGRKGLARRAARRKRVRPEWRVSDDRDAVLLAKWQYRMLDAAF